MRLWIAGILMLGAVGLWIALSARRPNVASTDLPTLGSVITPLPEGSGKAVAERACLTCHSSDILRQQRLSEKQWTGELTKMAGWGAEISDSDRVILLPYLVSQFGPDNERFVPITVQPVKVAVIYPH